MSTGLVESVSQGTGMQTANEGFEVDIVGSRHRCTSKVSCIRARLITFCKFSHDPQLSSVVRAPRPVSPLQGGRLTHSAMNVGQFFEGEMRLSERDVENLVGISRELIIETLEGPDALPGNSEQIPKILEDWKKFPYILQGGATLRFSNLDWCRFR